MQDDLKLSSCLRKFGDAVFIEDILAIDNTRAERVVGQAPELTVDSIGLEKRLVDLGGVENILCAVKVSVERLQVPGSREGLDSAVASQHHQIIVACAIYEIKQHFLACNILVRELHIHRHVVCTLEIEKFLGFLGARGTKEIGPGKTCPETDHVDLGCR